MLLLLILPPAPAPDPTPVPAPTHLLPLRKMEEIGLITKDTLRDLVFEKFERLPDCPKTAEEEDPLTKVRNFLKIN